DVSPLPLHDALPILPSWPAATSMEAELTITSPSDSSAIPPKSSGMSMSKRRSPVRGARDLCSIWVTIMAPTSRPQRRTADHAPRSWQTCPGWRRPATAAPRHQAGSGVDRLIQTADPLQRHMALEHLFQLVGVATEQHHGTAIATDRLAQRRKVGTLAIAAGNQHLPALQGIAETFNGRQRRTDVGGLGIVVVVHAGVLPDPLATVGQTGEVAQGIEHGRHRQPDSVTQRQRRQGIGLIVGAADLQLADRHQRLEFEGQMFLPVLLDQPEAPE